jgi:hypothetical protein
MIRWMKKMRGTMGRWISVGEGSSGEDEFWWAKPRRSLFQARMGSLYAKPLPRAAEAAATTTGSLANCARL